jgi:hypothetical protein
MLAREATSGALIVRCRAKRHNEVDEVIVRYDAKRRNEVETRRNEVETRRNEVETRRNEVRARLRRLARPPESSKGGPQHGKTRSC